METRTHCSQAFQRLPIALGIKSKILVVAYKVLCNLASSFLCDLVTTLPATLTLLLQIWPSQVLSQEAVPSAWKPFSLLLADVTGLS